MPYRTLTGATSSIVCATPSHCPARPSGSCCGRRRIPLRKRSPGDSRDGDLGLLSSWSRTMRRKPKWVPLLSVLCVALASLLSADALAAGPCVGHKLLRAPRPELSCSNVKPKVYPSPDGTLRAVVYPVDISLNATPDMESRVVIRASKGDTLTSKDYASPRGFNGYFVVNAKWSPAPQIASCNSAI